MNKILLICLALLLNACVAPYGNYGYGYNSGVSSPYYNGYYQQPYYSNSYYRQPYYNNSSHYGNWGGSHYNGNHYGNWGGSHYNGNHAGNWGGFNGNNGGYSHHH